MHCASVEFGSELSCAEKKGAGGKEGELFFFFLVVRGGHATYFPFTWLIEAINNRNCDGTSSEFDNFVSDRKFVTILLLSGGNVFFLCS